MTAEFHEIHPPEADLDMAIGFLKAINPDGRQMLVGQTDENGSTDTKHKLFEAGMWDQKRAQIKFWASERRNVWVLPNEPVAGATDAKDTSIGYIRAVWFDTDNKGVQEDALAAMGLLASVNDSGGGIHGFGILSEKVAVTPETKALAEKVGRGLQDRFGGDAVWNINRPMRVPGTVNYLNATKRAKGRQIAPTFVLASNDVRVTLEQMALAYPAQARSGSETKVTDEDVAKAMSEIDMSKVGGALPERLLKSGIMQSKLWLHGVTGEGDQTGSGNVFRLALDMRKGGYSATEFAQMACAWERADAKNTEHRSLARAWAKASPGRQAGRVFDAIDEEEAEAEAEKLRTTKIGGGAFELEDPMLLPRRAWLYGWRLIRGYLSSTVAAGGTGKSALTLVEAVAMATGRDLLGYKPVKALRVLVWNGEDPMAELKLRIAGIANHYGVSNADLGGRLFVMSGRDKPIVIASSGRNGAVADKGGIESIKKYLKKNAIDVVLIDPFVSSHRVAENDNMAIDLVAKAWSHIAEECGCAVDLVHHIRKPANGSVVDLGVDDARGASALINASRNARVLSPMGGKEAGDWGILRKKAYFSIQHDATKANMMPAGEGADWYHHLSVDVGNGDVFATPKVDGDSVGVVVRWVPPALIVSDDPDIIVQVQDEIVQGKYNRKDQRSDLWAGHVLGAALDLDMTKPDEKRRVVKTIDAWITKGWLEVFEDYGENRHKNKCVRPGKRPDII